MRVCFRRCDLLVAASARISQQHILPLKKARFPPSFFLSFFPSLTSLCSPNIIEIEAKNQTKLQQVFL
jgi:hypothetical protein